jgi:hypothetical protein
MPSSTSSSDRWRVVACLLVAALAVEGATRLVVFPRSKDFRRFAGYDDAARTLVLAPGFRVALVGNSATERGVDPQALQRQLGGASAALFVADQSRINTWHFILERHFFHPGRRPDQAVITFYEDDLEDGNPVEIGRLARFFTGVRDWPSVFRVDLPSVDERVAFVLASGSAAIAGADRLRERLLGLAVPEYQRFAEALNQAAWRHAERPARATTYRALDRLLARAAEVRVPLTFVAFPTREPYSLSPTTVARVRAAGAELLDLREVPGLEPRHYADGVHLTSEGKALYTARLAAALGATVGREVSWGASVEGSGSGARAQ